MIRQGGRSGTLRLNVAAISLMFLLTVSVFGVTLALAQDSPWEAPANAKKVVNPVKSTPEGLKQAAQLFQANCALCHGKTGAGDGPAGANQPQQPANFTDPNLMDH